MPEIELEIRVARKCIHHFSRDECCTIVLPHFCHKSSAEFLAAIFSKPYFCVCNSRTPNLENIRVTDWISSSRIEYLYMQN